MQALRHLNLSPECGALHSGRNVLNVKTSREIVSGARRFGSHNSDHLTQYTSIH